MTKKKHILVLSSWYPSRTAPFVGNFVKRQALLFAKEYNITVLFTKADASLQSIEIIETTAENFTEIIIYHPAGKSIFQKISTQKKAFKEGLKRIQNVDLIQGHVMLPKGWQFITAKNYFQCPLLVTEHGSYFRPEAKKNRTFIEKMILRKVKKQIDLLTCVSDFFRKDLQVDFPNFDIQLLPNAVNTSFFIPKTKEKNSQKEFLHISTLDEKLKNPKGIFDACSLLINTGNTNFQLTVVCDENYDQWINYTEKLGISSYVTFYGAKTSEELLSLYQNSDAFILFSNYETFSIVLVESWACGVPTLTTPVGIGYDLPDELGIQVERNSSRSLADAMLTIIQEQKTFSPQKLHEAATVYSEAKIISIFDAFVSKLTH